MKCSKIHDHTSLICEREKIYLMNDVQSIFILYIFRSYLLLYLSKQINQWIASTIQLLENLHCKAFTLALRPYFVVMLKNGTIVIVKTVPHKMPPIKPTICCCHGRVPIAKMHTAKKINFISAMCGRFNCFQ